MAKIDLELVEHRRTRSLREHATEKLFEKVAARRAELEAELEKLAQYGKPVKKIGNRAPIAKGQEDTEEDDKKADEQKEPVAKAA